MVHEHHPGVERVTVWQCIGCAKIEAPRPCIGVCEDHRIEMVYALEAFVRRFALTRPREGQWETSYRALQEQARRILPALAAGDASDLLRATAPANDAT